MGMSIAQPHVRARRPLAALSKLTVAALLINALVYLVLAVTTGPQPIILVHIGIGLIAATIVATGFRWSPALGALLSGLLLVEASFFLTDKLTQPDSTFAFALTATLFAALLVGLVAGSGATVQNFRGHLHDRHAPPWTYPGLFALAALVLGGTLSTAIQPRSIAVISPDVLATLPVLKTTGFRFDQPEITAKLGETVALRLVNADPATHYFDIDEFNVHALIPAGKSNVVLFRPTQPGTYTFYCHPHANKANGTGMIGTLIVAP
jgi:plastocyanin